MRASASIAGALTNVQREGIQNAYKRYEAIYSAAFVNAGSYKNAATSANLRVAAENAIAWVDALP